MEFHHYYLVSFHLFLSLNSDESQEEGGAEKMENKGECMHKTNTSVVHCICMLDRSLTYLLGWAITDYRHLRNCPKITINITN
jgi:hypothetical protein